MSLNAVPLTDFEQEFPLPEGWQWRTFAQVCQVNPVVSKPKEFSDTTEISFIPMAAVDDQTGRIQTPTVRRLDQVWTGYKKFQNGDVIFARITPCMENGKAAIASNLVNGIACGSTEFIVLRANPYDVIPEWIYYFVRQKSFRDKAAANFTGTAGQLRVPASYVEQQGIPIPPITEQRRIVSKIEYCTQQIQSARTAFSRTPPLLKAFRQAVLAAALRGKLSEREAGDEPAERLLERIRTERRRKWEDGLRARGTDPETAVYAEPRAVDGEGLPELPEGWVWTTLDVLAEVRSGVTKGRDLSRFETVEVPYLRVANVQAGYLDLREVKQIAIKAGELENYRLHVNDILYTEGGDRDKLGRGTVWKGEVDPCIHQNHIFCARLYLSQVSPEWVSLTGQLEYARDYVNSVASQSVNLASINSTNLKAMPIPLPPVQEQRRIVEKLRRLNAQAEAAEAAFEAASRRLDALEQAVLGKAFRGVL